MIASYLETNIQTKSFNNAIKGCGIRVGHEGREGNQHAQKLKILRHSWKKIIPENIEKAKLLSPPP